MTDRATLQQRLTSGDSLISLGGSYVCDGPLQLPDWPLTIQGSGIESTELVFTGGSDGLIGNYSTFYTNGPLTVKNLTLSQSGQGGTAIRLTYPRAGSVNEVTAHLEQLCIRPSPTLGTRASWKHIADFYHCWNLNLDHVTAHGCNDDYDPAKPFLMESGLRFYGGCQDAHVSHFRLTGGVDVGVLAVATELGECEGLVMTDGHLIGARRCLVLDSDKMPNKWPTPLASIKGMHFAYHEIGLLAIGRADMKVIGNDFSATQFARAHSVGAYVAGGSRNAVILGNTFGSMSQVSDIAYAVLVDASEAATMIGNAMTTSRGIWLTPSSSRCVGMGNTYGAACIAPVTNQRDQANPNRNRREDNLAA